MNLKQKVFEAMDQFIAEYNGKPIDIDRKYGTQCVDTIQGGWRWFFRKLLNNLDAWLVTVTGTAVGFWTKMAGILNPNKKIFVRIPHGTRRYQKADMLVWNTRLKPMNLDYFINIPTGHTAYFVKYVNATTIQVFQQDGDIDKNQDGLADGVAHLKNWGIDSGILGAYRLKIADDDSDQSVPVPATQQTTKYYTTYTIPEETRVMMNTPTTTLWNVDFPTKQWHLAKQVGRLPAGKEVRCNRVSKNTSGGVYMIPIDSPDSYGINKADTTLLDEPTIETLPTPLPTPVQPIAGTPRPGPVVIQRAPDLNPDQPTPDSKMTTATVTTSDKPNSSSLDPLISAILKFIRKFLGKA